MNPITRKSLSAQAWQPLIGIRIADFSFLFPGPFTTAILADLGAEVVKVEPPAGDLARSMIPDMFASTGRNKRSVVLDLKSDGVEHEIHHIAGWADVIIEGFRPGVAARLGIGSDKLSAINPRLIYCSLSGFGQNGPWANRPGHDLNYLAAAGALAYPGMWGRLPGRGSLPLGDIAGGSFAAIAILAALRERDRKSDPIRLDLSLFEAVLYCVSLRHGADESTAPDLYPGNDIYATKDGALLTLALVEDHFWMSFVNAVADFAAEFGDSRFDTVEMRKRHGDEIDALLRTVLKTRTAQAWKEIFAGTDVPFQICLTPEQAMRSEQAQTRKCLVTLERNHYVPFPVIVNGESRPQVLTPAPELGMHTQSFLRSASRANGAAVERQAK